MNQSIDSARLTLMLNDLRLPAIKAQAAAGGSVHAGSRPDRDQTGAHRLFRIFTEAGLTALRQLVLDARAMDPSRFGHLREQLGLQAPE